MSDNHELALMETAPEAASQNISIETHLRSLTACLSQFLNPAMVGKAVLAAGRATGLDEAVLQIKLQEMGAVSKDEDDGGKKKKKKRTITGDEKTRNVSFYSLFITRQCAASKVHDAQNPLPPGEKKRNSLKDAIAAWSGRSDEDKAKFEQQYGGLIADLNARIHAGEKIPDIASEILKFEKEQGLPGSAGYTSTAPSTSGKKSKQAGAPDSATKRKPEAAVAAAPKPGKKAKAEPLAPAVKEEEEESSSEGETDEDEEESDDDEDGSGEEAAGNGVAAAGGDSSSEGSDDEDESDSEPSPVPPPKTAPKAPTPLKKKAPVVKPAAATKAPAAKAPAAAKPAVAGGKQDKAKQEKVKQEKEAKGKKKKGA